MTLPGQGWARRVTSATLSQFRTLLRTGAERAAEARPGEENESSDVPTAGPATSGSSTSDRDAVSPEALFRGTAIVVPSQHRVQRNNRVAAQKGATVPSSTPVPQPSAPVSAASSGGDLEIVRRWFKVMREADAQRPSGGNTNPTGHLTLVRSGHPIAHTTWFRQDLFAEAEWIQAGTREHATITFHVHIRGEENGDSLQDLGRIPLEVRHTPSFEAGQGNRTTTLHWGTTMGIHFRQHNYTGYYVTIERTSAGEFRMIIDHAPVGEFMG